jgi:hypothetical protein
MKMLPLAAALLVAAPAFADDAKPAAPQAPVAAQPAVAPVPANFEVPMKTQELDGLDKLMEKRMAAKKLPASDNANLGLREVPKKKDDEAKAEPAGNGAAAQH